MTQPTVSESTERSSGPKDRLQSTRSTSPCYKPTHAYNKYTKMNLSTVKWAQWRKTQSRELLGLFICVCIALCTIVAHNIAQNRPDNFPSYPLDNHHCSGDVYLRGMGVIFFRSPESIALPASATGYYSNQQSEQKVTKDRSGHIPTTSLHYFCPWVTFRAPGGDPDLQ